LKTVANLVPGESGFIENVAESEILLKLLDMGCLPGERVMMKYIAPLGDPICINISGYDLILRLDEASTIELK
jgi:ferrous iron transport protein A